MGFGKGLYFADVVSKSANYCWATREHPYGYLILAEVVLGSRHKLTAADPLEGPPPGTDSVWGVGKTTHDPRYEFESEHGTFALGKPVSAKLDVDSDLIYNEFIVYREAR